MQREHREREWIELDGMEEGETTEKDGAKGFE